MPLKILKKNFNISFSKIFKSLLTSPGFKSPQANNSPRTKIVSEFFQPQPTIMTIHNPKKVYKPIAKAQVTHHFNNNNFNQTSKKTDLSDNITGKNAVVSLSLQLHHFLKCVAAT